MGKARLKAREREREFSPPFFARFENKSDPFPDGWTNYSLVPFLSIILSFFLSNRENDDRPRKDFLRLATRLATFLRPREKGAKAIFRDQFHLYVFIATCCRPNADRRKRRIRRRNFSKFLSVANLSLDAFSLILLTASFASYLTSIPFFLMRITSNIIRVILRNNFEKNLPRYEDSGNSESFF